MTGTASAGEVETKVKVTNRDEIRGKVRSDDATCQERRKVILRERPQFPGGGDEKHDIDHTNATGRFNFHHMALDPDGKYYVKARRIPGVCAEGISENFRVPDDSTDWWG